MIDGWEAGNMHDERWNEIVIYNVMCLAGRFITNVHPSHVFDY